jgi:hypothetical protein
MGTPACRQPPAKLVGSGVQGRVWRGAAAMPPVTHRLRRATWPVGWGRWPVPHLPARPMATVPLAAQPGDAGRTRLAAQFLQLAPTAGMSHIRSAGCQDGVSESEPLMLAEYVTQYPKIFVW